MKSKERFKLNHNKIKIFTNDILCHNETEIRQITDT